MVKRKRVVASNSQNVSRKQLYKRIKVWACRELQAFSFQPFRLHLLRINSGKKIAKNYSTKLSGQIGESLVVAELGRRGIVATTFAGNVPDIDILAYKNGNTIPIQVKALKKGKVSFDAKQYLNIKFNGKMQEVKGIEEFEDKDLIYVFVMISEKLGSDKFYILKKHELARIMKDHHEAFLAKHNGIRPKNHESTHCGLKESEFGVFEDNWHLIETAFH